MNSAKRRKLCFDNCNESALSETGRVVDMAKMRRCDPNEFLLSDRRDCDLFSVVLEFAVAGVTVVAVVA